MLRPNIQKKFWMYGYFSNARRGIRFPEKKEENVNQIFNIQVGLESTLYTNVLRYLRERVVRKIRVLSKEAYTWSQYESDNEASGADRLLRSNVRSRC